MCKAGFIETALTDNRKINLKITSTAQSGDKKNLILSFRPKYVFYAAIENNIQITLVTAPKNIKEFDKIIEHSEVSFCASPP